MTSTKTAARHEARLLWAANPGLFALLEAARHTGPIARVPRLGWVVTDPVLARHVLNDHAAFGMTGEGGVGHLWTRLFGDEMAQFFGGARHAKIRTRARDLFTEDAARTLVERSQGPSHAALADRLAAGGTVDVADAARPVPAGQRGARGPARRHPGPCWRAAARTGWSRGARRGASSSRRTPSCGCGSPRSPGSPTAAPRWRGRSGWGRAPGSA